LQLRWRFPHAQKRHRPRKAMPKGRVLKWFATNAKAVQDEADRHCKQYGKLAHITEMRTDAGGRVLFECT
jgi:hypothetical protein